MRSTPGSTERAQTVAASTVITGREWTWVAGVAAPVLAAIAGLNVLVAALAPPASQFLGFVYAWDDGAGYLAAMREGARGAWLFTLPYTAADTGSFFLYPQYLLLGHLSAWFGLESVVVFHVARVAASAVLLASLYAFLGRIFADVRDRRLAFLLASLGSGLGWLALIAGQLTPDVWQYEISIFLAMLASPHFALSMACLLWLMELLGGVAAPLSRAQWLRLVAGTFVLAMMQPYALVVVLAVVAAWLAVQRLYRGEWARTRLVRLSVVALSAAPFALYYVWAQVNVPAFAGWQAQDVTLSPPPADYLVAGGLPLALAVLGAAVMLPRFRSRLARTPITPQTGLLLVFWLILCAVLLYEPLSHHQRRFAFGIGIPIACLAVCGYRRLQTTRLRFSPFTLVVFCGLTNLALLVHSFALAQQHPGYLFLSRSEWDGVAYLRTQPANKVVLASPLMGLFIPAWSDQRVVFGHPHETLNAAATQQAVERFFDGSLSDVETFLKPVDYIFVGPRERALGVPAIPANYLPAFSDGDVTIYVRH